MSISPHSLFPRSLATTNTCSLHLWICPCRTLIKNRAGPYVVFGSGFLPLTQGFQASPIYCMLIKSPPPPLLRWAVQYTASVQLHPNLLLHLSVDRISVLSTCWLLGVMHLFIFKNAFIYHKCKIRSIPIPIYPNIQREN